MLQVCRASILAKTTETSLENGILFMAYGQCQNFVCFLRNKSHCEQLTTGENMAAGSCASIFSSLALCPTELVKCQMQTLNEIKQIHPSNLDQHLHNVKTPLDLTRNIVRTEGVRGLFRGFSTTLVRECPGYGCFFGGYELTRSLLTSENESKAEIGRKRIGCSRQPSSSLLRQAS
jgi:solute carrier family 25 (mitochondrial ornithine transporter) member 2/15